MANIDDLLEQIQSAIYGKEVRGAIHDAIQQCYEDTETYRRITSTIAPTFDTSVPYAAGDYVWYYGTLYHFKHNHVAGEWSWNDVELAYIGEDLGDLENIVWQYNRPNCRNLLNDYSIVSGTQYGVTCTYNTDGSVTFSGTNTHPGGGDLAFFYLEPSAIPSNLEKGGYYRCQMDSNVVAMIILWNSVLSPSPVQISVDEITSESIVRVPEAANYCAIYLRVPNGVTVNETVHPVVFVPVGTKELSDEVEELKSAFDAVLCETEDPSITRGKYISTSTGIESSSGKYACTGLMAGYGVVSLINLSGSVYKYGVQYFDETGDTSTGTGYIGSSGSYAAGDRYIPSNAKKIGISFTRNDSATLTDSDIIAIKSALTIYKATDKTFTKEWKSADAKATGDRFDLLKNEINDITGNMIYDGFQMNKWIDTSGTVDITAPEYHSGAACIAVPCVKGDVFTLTGTGFTTSHMLYVVINASGTKRQSSGSRATLNKAEITIGEDDSAYLVMNVDAAQSYSVYKNTLNIKKITENRAYIDTINDNVFFPYTSFVNGNINSSGNNSSNTHPLRSGYIPIDEFVSVEVLTTGYRYQLFAYDGAYAYLGYGGTTRNYKKTRDDVLTDFPGTKYVRIKIGSSDDTEYLNPANLAAYGYTGLVRISQESLTRIETGGGSSGKIDVMSMVESFKDEDGYYSKSFVLTVDLYTVPKILTITAQYTGNTAPTVQIKSINPATDYAIFESPLYTLGSIKEPTRKSWRLPMASALYTKGKMIFTIPSGTKVTIRNAQLKADQRNRNTEFGIRYHGHRGAIAPADTVEAFQLGAELGYNTMITIPKFTSDGTAICYHDDSNVSDLRMIDGSTIPDEATSPISSFTYNYITENFRIASTVWGILHVPTIEEYFRVCSLTGMKPILSIHPAEMFAGSTGTAHFNTLKSLAKKWRVLKGIGIKSGNNSVMACAKGVFGTDARYIWISGQSHDPYGIWTLCKEVGFVAADATDLTGCEYDLTSEYFYTQTIEGADHYTATMAQIADLYAKGFKISVAETNAISGAEMERLIGVGVTEFTVNSHISMGLDW